ncbi:MAG TPA: tRNA epoxyqueuosine(34) reductase QueG [Longimicrobiales bacterium]|nr:tRNA epoxyqueuosine(34) reductase QueG [Longimicrobiales bacterium]
MKDGLAALLKERALEQGFGLAGIAEVRESDHADFLRDWLAAGYHGEMAYLARPDAVARRADPRRQAGDPRTDASDPRTHAGDLRSALVVADFYPADGEEPDRAVADSRDRAPVRRPDNPSTGVIARYARGRDYHRVVKGKLRRLLRWLEGEVGRPLPAARACVDTSPVLERELARRAGIGWFGRNTMLIHPRRGSYFFLGVLLTELDLEPDAPFEPDHCGTCRACLDACPTGALLGRDENGAPVMDARLCISYLTIEHRGPIPPELRPAIGNRVFGCDICQEVCPFPRKFSRPTSEPSFAARAPGEPPSGVERIDSDVWHPGTSSPSLVDLLAMTLDEASWESFSRGSAVRRAGRSGLARNVCVGLGNWGSPDAVPVLTRALSDEEPLVRAHAAWALGRVGSSAAADVLSTALESEEDVFVREELESALGAHCPARSRGERSDRS